MINCTNEHLTFHEGNTNVDRARQTIGAMQEALIRAAHVEFSRRFGTMLDKGHQRYHAMGTIHEYMEWLSATIPDDVIREVSFDLHDYSKYCGVSTVGIGVVCQGRPSEMEPDGRVLLLPEEKAPPTMLFTPELPKIYRPALFGLRSISSGAEKTTVVSDKATMRGYLPGEPMQKTDSIPQLRRGQSILTPHGTMLGIRTQIMDKRVLDSSPFPHAALLSERTRHVPKDETHRGEVLWLTSLTRDEALRILENLERPKRDIEMS